MKRLLTLASLFLISAVPGDAFESITDEEEIFECFRRLTCILNKDEEFYKIGEDAGPENNNAFMDITRQVTGLDIPDNDKQFWIKFKEITCPYPKEKLKKHFKEGGAAFGEYILEICRKPNSELCKKADATLKTFAATIVKYKAMGKCPRPAAGMGQLGSPPFG